MCTTVNSRAGIIGGIAKNILYLGPDKVQTFNQNH